MYIKFQDSNNIYEAKVIPNGNVVTLEFENTVVVDKSGFLAYKDKKCEYLVGRYLGYTSIYRNDEETQACNAIQLSNDGSVYVAPEPIPESAPIVRSLEEVKVSKIATSKSLLVQYLEENPLVSKCHGDKEGTYSVTEANQARMTSQYLSYTIEKQILGNATLTWNETGKSCEEWTEEEFLQLVMEVKNYVYPYVSAQQTWEEQINACETVEEVDEIVIDYSAV